MKNKEFDVAIKSAEKMLTTLIKGMKKIVCKLPRTEEVNSLFDEKGNPKEIPGDERITIMYSMLKISGRDINELCLGLFLKDYESNYKDIEIKDQNYRVLISEFFDKKDFESFIKIKQYEMGVKKIKGSC
ncbi:MAG: hypothetical protein ACRC6K_04475 [Fusobacteriaceae bacterium]